MKADFQMTELKLKYAKWQYDVNKGAKRPMRSQKRNPALNWSSDSVSLPDIPENMAARRRGEGSPSTAHQIMNLSSFGNDGRRRDTSGQHRLVNQRILSSPGGQNPRAMMSQSTPSLGSYGIQSHVLSSTKTNQQTITSPSLPANNYGLEAMELKRRNINKQVEKERSPSQRTLVAPLKQFGDNQQNSQRMHGSGDMESHGYQMDHQRRSERSGTTNILTSHIIPSPRTIIQRGITERTNQGTPHTSQRDHQQRFERSGTSNIGTSHSVPQTRSILQDDFVARTNQGTYHGYQRDHQQRFERSGTSNIQTSHSAPSTRTIVQNDITMRANQGTSHGYQWDHQRQFERSGTSNIQTSHSVPSTRTIVQNDITMRENQGTSHGYQRDHQRQFERSGTSNVQTSHSVPNASTILQDKIVAPPNLDLADMKIERERLLNDLSNILLEDVAHQDEMEEEMSSGGISDGSGYDFEDSWDMETSESPVDTNDVGTQFPYPDEGGSSQDTFEAIESMQDESQCLIEGSDETFQSSDCTFDVCIQVSVRTTTKTTPDGFPDAFHTQDNFENQNELSVDHIDTAGNIQFDNLELQEDTPSMTPLPETGNTMNEQHPSVEAVEDLVLALNHPNDNAQVSAVRVNRGIELEKLAQEMDGCNEPAEEQPKQAPGFLSHMDKTSVKSQSDTKKVVVEEFVPYLECSKDTMQFSAVGAHHDNMLEKLAQEMENDNTTVSSEQRERTPETFSQLDEPSVNSQSDTKRVVVEEFIPLQKCSKDTVQFSAVGAHHGDMLEKLAQEMEKDNTAVSSEQRERTPETFSQLDEPSVNSQSDTKKVVVEEFLPRLKCSKDTVQFSAVGVHHDDMLEKLAQEMENDNTTISSEKSEQTEEIFPHVNETSVNSQSDTKKVVVEEFLPRLKCSKDTVQFNAVGVHHGDMLEKLAQEMENGNTTISSEKSEQTEEIFPHVSETSVNSQSDTKKVVVEEFLPRLKCSKDTVQFSAVGAHHDDMLEKLAQEMEIENTTASMEKREQTPETVPYVDETSVNSQRDTSKRVVDELVPRVKASHDNSQLCAIVADHDDVFSAIAAHHDDVLEKPKYEMDTCNIPERTDGSEHLVDDDLHISADDIKSDHAEPQEQSVNTSSCLDQRPMKNQTDTKKTVVEEFMPCLSSSSFDLRFSADSGHSEDGLKRPTQEMNKCTNTANGDLEELHSTNDLPAESQPSPELHISEDVEYDQADLLKETRLDQRSLQRLDDTIEEVVQELVPSVKLPHDEAERNTNDTHHNNALEKLAEEIYKSNNPVVSAEQEIKFTASDRSDLYDDKTPVQDKFCEFRAGDNKQSLNLSHLSSPVEEDNASLVQTKISVGSPSVETAQISSSKDLCNGSDQISHCRVENEAESRENDGRVSVDAEDPVTPNTLANIPNPRLEIDFPSLPTLVEDKNELTEEKDPLSQGASKVSAAPRDNDKPDTDQKNSEQLSISLDVSAEFHTAFENELAIDDLSKDRIRFKDNDDAANQKSPKDINVKDSGVRGPVSPRRSKIPVPKSKLSRSKSCPTRNRSNGKVHKQNSQTPKDHECTKEGALINGPISDKTLHVNVKTTSPTFSNSFPVRHDRSRGSFKGNKQQNSRIPVPTSNFKRTGSCPNRSRPRIVELNDMSLSNRSKRASNLTSHTPASRDNTSKTRSRDIDITEALAVCDKEDAATTAAVQGDEKSTQEIESRIPDASNSSILLGEKPNDLAVDDMQSFNAVPSEIDEFIKRAKQILSRIPVSQTNAPKTRSVPFDVKPSEREVSHESNNIKGPPEEVPYADYRTVSSPENDTEFVSLEADAEDDTASETHTLHSDNDCDIQSPLHDEVLRIELSETEEDVFESDDQKSSTSRIPVLTGSRKPIHSDAPVEEKSDTEDEVVSDLSGKERSVARISPMPREDGGDLTPMPRFRKSLKSRIPIPSPVAIKPPSRTNRSRSYSEADGGNAINPEDESDKVSREEPDDADDEDIMDHYSELEKESIPKRTQSSREVRPRGSYWTFSTSPSLAVSEFERSQTLRPNRSRSIGRKSPAGTPRTTPRGTPRSTPRGTPRSTPRGTPRDTPRGGSLRRQYPHSKTPPTFKSRECAIVPLPEWNRLREVLSSGEQSKQSTRPPSPSEFSYTSRRSSNEFPRVHSPKWEIPATTPKPSRWRADGRVPSHLKKKYSSMNDMGNSEDFYPSDQNLAEPGMAKQENDSPWMMKSPIRASSSQSVPHTDRYGVDNKSANPLGERSFTDANASGRRSPCASETTTDFPMSSTGDVSAIWTEDDTLESSNFSIPAGAKKKSWKRRLSIKRKKSVDPSKEQGKEPEEVKREKKKRKNWLLRILGIRK